MTPDPFGRALRDHHRGERTGPLIARDGAETRDHPIEEFYFGAFEEAGDGWLASRLDGPVLDAGAGVGRHALALQERCEIVAIEASDRLVETMRERGVRDARRGDMFSLREQFERDRFRSAIAVGTQVGLAGSMRGLRRFLGDLAFATTPDATAVLDCYDPGGERADELLGYRADPTPGLAHRVLQFEYEGDLGAPLLFRLFGPDRLREAAAGTGWIVDEIRRGPDGDDTYYRAALTKR